MNWTVPTDLWKGKTVWILGGGPSLTRQFGVPQELIEKIEKGHSPVSSISPYLKPIHNEIVIGINMAFRLGDWIDMAFWGDPGFYKKPKVAEDLKAFPGMKVACNQRFNSKQMEELGIWAIRRLKRKHGISEDPSAVCWNGNSGAAAISVAANAGASRIILVGFDMCSAPTHSHWHNEYKKAKKPPFKTHLQGFKQIYADAKKRGIEILNMSPSSQIIFFPKVTLQDVLEGKPIKSPIMVDLDYEKSIGSLPKYGTLRKIHQIVRPKTYLEIGIGRGNSLKCSTAESNIAIDPSPRLRQKFENTQIYKDTSDKFFKHVFLDQSCKPDLCFIDGLHLIENVLKDFINCEKNSKPNTVIVLDDVCPAHPIQAHRIKQSIKWTGDVWKIVPILRQHRPDLTLNIIDTAPTGMLVVTGLDPQNTVLEEKYDELIKEWQGKQVPEEVIKRPGVQKDLEFLKQFSLRPIKIGVITPTAHPDRRPFLEFLKERMRKQTRQPDHWEIVDFPNDGHIDLSKRYKIGITELLNKGCDLILFMEDDDYYPLDYIEQMEKAWIEAGYPVLFGVAGTTYYYLQKDAFRYFKNPTHSSAFCSGVSKGVDYQKCGDHVRSFDLYLWSHNKGVRVEIPNKPIGIKHGIGMTGKNYHAKENGFNATKEPFENLVDEQAYNFYQKIKEQCLTES